MQSLKEKIVKVGPMSENPMEPSHWNLLENPFINSPEEQGKLLLVHKHGLSWLKIIQKSHPCQGPFSSPASSGHRANPSTPRFDRILAEKV